MTAAQDAEWRDAIFQAHGPPEQWKAQKAAEATQLALMPEAERRTGYRKYYSLLMEGVFRRL